MDREYLKSIVQLMQRMSYFDNLQYLQYYSSRFDLQIDFDCLYFSKSDIYSVFPMAIAAISSTLLKDDCLYILTKKNELQCIDSVNKEHIVTDINYSIWARIRQFFNY